MKSSADNTLLDQLRLALSNHQQGRLDDAEALYRRVLQIEPRQHDALRLLGVLFRQRGDPTQARHFLEESLHTPFVSAEAHHELALVFHDLGRFDDAIAAYLEALKLRPGFPEAHYNLGNAYYAAGRNAEAIACYHHALALQPDLGEAYCNLGMVELSDGNTLQAVAHLKQAVRLRPDHSEALLNLAIACEKGGLLAEAEASLRTLLARDPDSAVAHLKLATLLEGGNQLGEAQRHAEAAIRLAPENPEPYLCLGTLLIRQNRVPDAVPYYNHAVQLDPDSSSCALPALRELLRESARSWEQQLERNPSDFGALLSLAKVRYSEKRPHDAIALLQRALAVKPGDPNAEYALGFTELLLGRFESGWRHYEARFGTGQKEFPCRQFPQPRWSGESLQGKTILVYAEQGAGDTIQFVRYVSLVAELGGRVILECQPALKPLLRTDSCVDTVVVQGEPLPPFDVHVPLLSLPAVFQTRLESIPKDVPYLRVPACTRFDLPASPRHALKVGIVWAGNPVLPNDLARSLPLAELSPLWSLPNVVYFSLQVGPARRQLSRPKDTRELADLQPMLADFAETAAAIQQLDLVISVDTAVAHLAGALARPVWILLPHAPEWRWLLDRDDSPWYPSARLFRQPQPEDWRRPIDQIREQLARRIHER